MATVRLVQKNQPDPGREPLTTDLLLGELAINTYDGTLFLKKDTGTESIVNIGEYAMDAHLAAADPHTQYSQAGDNVSDFVNDAGYITSASVPVQSVFGRTGIVVATEGDYDIDQLGDVDTSTVSPSVNDILKWDGSNWVPTSFSGAPVTSVFGRTGDVTAQVGDYAAFYTQPGDNVSVFVNDAGYLTDITNENLGDLSDVTLTAEADKEALVYDSGTGDWVNEPVVNSIFGRTGDVLAQASDYSAHYATTAQGALADTAVQPGDNVSVLVNDANYISWYDIIDGGTW